MHHSCVIADMRLVLQLDIEPRTRVYDRLTFQAIAQVLAEEIIFQGAVVVEGF